MKVTVYHQDHETAGRYTRVCVVDCGDRDIDHSLGYAYYRTQNVEGSWSKQDLGLDEINEDWSEDVSEIAPLPVIKGKEFGHRSSMMGDRFHVEGYGTYTAEMIGFSSTPESLAPGFDPTGTLSVDNLAKIGKEIVAQERTKTKQSKKEVCEELFGLNYGKKSRKDIIDLFINTAGLTKAGANTYFYNCKKALEA